MERLGYDFQNPATLGNTVEVKHHGLTKTHIKIQKQQGSVGVSKARLDFTPR